MGSARPRSPKDDPDATLTAPIAGASLTEWVIDAVLGASVRRVGLLGVELSDTERDSVLTREDKALIECVDNGRDVVSSLDRALHLIGPDMTLSDDAHILLLSVASPQISSAELKALTDRHVHSGAAATVVHNEGLSEEIDTDAPVLTFGDDGVLQSILDPVSSRPAEPVLAMVRAPLLMPAIRRVMPERFSSRLLINDAVATLEESGHDVAHEVRTDPLQSVVDGGSRAAIESQIRRRVVHEWIDRGVQISDPMQVSIDSSVVIGQGVRILPGTVIEGTTVIADGATVGPNTHLVDATIGAGAVIPNSSISNTEVGPHEVLVPFSVRHG
jgi:bifunctional UDP-N-acetylglucosamine pyrophosphorylase/glucosamine-1-phosphate N-acetyltransferase